MYAFVVGGVVMLVMVVVEVICKMQIFNYVLINLLIFFLVVLFLFTKITFLSDLIVSTLWTFSTPFVTLKNSALTLSFSEIVN